MPFRGVTMSLHKLTAGSGYDYLTRQVAALDATDKGHTGLASYYTERGESPGIWVGSGLAGIDGLDVGDPVTAEQMRNLFGAACTHSPTSARSSSRAPTSRWTPSRRRCGSALRFVSSMRRRRSVSLWRSGSMT
jgi:hypothetical protein